MLPTGCLVSTGARKLGEEATVFLGYRFDDAIQAAILCTRVEPELVHDVTHVAIDGALGDEEASSDPLVTEALGDEPRDICFRFPNKPVPVRCGLPAASGASPSASAAAASLLKPVSVLNSASNFEFPSIAIASFPSVRVAEEGSG